MEVLEHDVACLESGERIQKRPRQRIQMIPLRQIPADITVRCQGCDAGLDRHNHRHQIRKLLLLKGIGQPEKRTAHNIKREVTDQCAAQIQIPVPKEFTVSDGTVRQNVKRHLLYIVIAVKEKEPVIPEKNRKHT